MKKLAFILMILLMSTCISFAQSTSKSEKVESAKIAFLSKKLNLSPQQAQKFWPLYNEYSEKRKEIQQQKKLLKQDDEVFTASDSELLTEVNKLFELRQQELTLEKNYKDRFLQIINIRQLVALYRGEKEFLQLLKDKIAEKKGE